MELASLIALAKEHPVVWIPIVIYLCLNIWIKVSEAPTKKEGWQNVLKSIGQRISATDFKGGAKLTLPGKGTKEP